MRNARLVVGPSEPREWSLRCPGAASFALAFAPDGDDAAAPAGVLRLTRTRAVAADGAAGAPPPADALGAGSLQLPIGSADLSLGCGERRDGYHGDPSRGHKFWVYPPSMALVTPRWDTHLPAVRFCSRARYVSTHANGVVEWCCGGHASRTPSAARPRWPLCLPLDGGEVKVAWEPAALPEGAQRGGDNICRSCTIGVTAVVPTKMPTDAAAAGRALRTAAGAAFAHGLAATLLAGAADALPSPGGDSLGIELEQSAADEEQRALLEQLAGGDGAAAGGDGAAASGDGDRRLSAQPDWRALLQLQSLLAEAGGGGAPMLRYAEVLLPTISRAIGPAMAAGSFDDAAADGEGEGEGEAVLEPAEAWQALPAVAVEWDATDVESRGFRRSDIDGSGRARTFSFPNGAICLLSTQLVTDAADGERPHELVPKLVARFRVTSNRAWGVGLVAEREPRKLRNYWQDNGRTGWNSRGLSHGNTLPEAQMHEADVEVYVDGVDGEIVLRVNDVEQGRQRITEPLPAHLCINGNNGTVVTVLDPAVAGGAADAGAAAVLAAGAAVAPTISRSPSGSAEKARGGGARRARARAGGHAPDVVAPRRRGRRRRRRAGGRGRAAPRALLVRPGAGKPGVELGGRARGARGPPPPAARPRPRGRRRRRRRRAGGCRGGARARAAPEPPPDADAAEAAVEGGVGGVVGVVRVERARGARVCAHA